MISVGIHVSKYEILKVSRFPLVASPSGSHEVHLGKTGLSSIPLCPLYNPVLSALWWSEAKDFLKGGVSLKRFGRNDVGQPEEHRLRIERWRAEL